MFPRPRSWPLVGALAALALIVPPATPALAAVDSMTVDMSTFGGAPTYRASGFIYGLSQNGSTPSASLQSQIKVRTMRAGGSQIGCPNGGFVNGGYPARWNFIKAYYARARGTGAHYSLLVSGVWGADGVCLDYVKANNVLPNIMSWHDLPGDPAADSANLAGMLSSRGLSVARESVNEYGAFGDEQQLGPSAWYIARLERCNCDGARANWGNVGQTPSLYDTMGWLVTANANQPMGQWWVYQRYASQTGQRTKITAGASHDGTVFQDSSARKSVAVLGAKAGGAQGAIDVRYANIPSWLVTSGSVGVLVERMPSTNAYVSAPTVVSNSRFTVSGNAVTVSINWTSAKDAYAITLTP